MPISIFKSATLLAACAAISTAIVCPENYCNGVSCQEELDNSHRPPCGSNQRLERYGTFCGCCQACITQIGEGAFCSLGFGLSAPPPLEECGAGLECTRTKAGGRLATCVNSTYEGI